MLTTDMFGRLMGSVDSCPWGASTGRHVTYSLEFSRLMPQRSIAHRRPLYTPEERIRRDSSSWTLVQGILAPVQFLVFLVSLGLVVRFLATGRGEQAATVSIVVKTMVLYTIMVTGACWERAVYGQYLFAPAFFWEDAVSMIVIGLHTIYLTALLSGSLDTHALMVLALAAYGTYLLNAGQFVMKLRTARLDAARQIAMSSPWQDARHA